MIALWPRPLSWSMMALQSGLLAWSVCNCRPLPQPSLRTSCSTCTWHVRLLVWLIWHHNKLSWFSLGNNCLRLIAWWWVLACLRWSDRQRQWSAVAPQLLGKTPFASCQLLKLSDFFLSFMLLILNSADWAVSFHCASLEVSSDSKSEISPQVDESWLHAWATLVAASQVIWKISDNFFNFSRSLVFSKMHATTFEHKCLASCNCLSTSCAFSSLFLIGGFFFTT